MKVVDVEFVCGVGGVLIGLLIVYKDVFVMCGWCLIVGLKMFVNYESLFDVIVVVCL